MSVVVAQHTTGAINVMNGGRMTPLALPPAATTRPRSPLFVALLLLSWAALIAATVLARFGAPSVKALLGAYGWRTTIVDALGWEPRTLWGTSLLKARDPDRVFLTTNDWGASLRTPMHKYTYVRTKWIDRGPVWRPLHKATAHYNEVVLADSDCSFPKSVLEMPRMHDLMFKALGEWSAPIL